MDNISDNKCPTFYTMMLGIQNIHLIKDVGRIPYILNTKYGYNSYIVSFGIPKCKFTYLNTNAKGISFSFCKNYTRYHLINGIIWLWNNSKKNDILNLYHYTQSSFIWILIYKLKNPNGKIYLKLDIDGERGIQMKMNRRTAKWILTKYTLGKCKLISAETETFCNFANKYWPIHLKWIPNGVLKEEIKNITKKKKIILCVGRLGTKQKATEILIESFEKAYTNISPEWKLWLVGSMEPEFENYLLSKLNKNPELNKRITYLGQIYDRKEMCKIYEDAAIITLPSRWESFNMVALEALAKSAYLISSDLVSFREMTNYGEFGAHFQVDCIDDYARKMITTCKLMDDQKLNFNKHRLFEHMCNQYCYEEICRKIDKYLRD